MGGVETWRTNRKKVTEVLEYGLQAGLYSDVGFLVGPEKFRLNAHKNILMMRSEVFVAMFSEKWNTEGWTTVELVDNDPDTFKAFLRVLIITKNLKIHISSSSLLYYIVCLH